MGMAAPSAKMPTVEAFCSSQGSLEGIWLERAKQLVGEVPEERASKLAEFRERIGLLSEQLEGLAGSKLIKEESFLIRFLRGSNWDVDIGAELIAGSHRMIQDYYPYMSAGPPSALEHVWSRNLIFSPEMRDDEGNETLITKKRFGRPARCSEEQEGEKRQLSVNAVGGNQRRCLPRISYKRRCLPSAHQT